MERGAKMLPPRPPPGLKLNITRVFFAVLIRRETKIEEAFLSERERGEERMNAAESVCCCFYFRYLLLPHAFLGFGPFS